MPVTRLEQVFTDGICDACHSAVEKHGKIDLDKRSEEFKAILDKYRSKDGSQYHRSINMLSNREYTILISFFH
jgi:hypothetical protein